MTLTLRTESIDTGHLIELYQRIILVASKQCHLLAKTDCFVFVSGVLWTASHLVNVKKQDVVHCHFHN